MVTNWREMITGEMNQSWISFLEEINLEQVDGKWLVNYKGQRVGANLTLLNGKHCVMVGLGNCKIAFAFVPNLRPEWVTRKGLWSKFSWEE